MKRTLLIALSLLLAMTVVLASGCGKLENSESSASEESESGAGESSAEESVESSESSAGESSEESGTNEEHKLLLLGDSITYGYGLEGEDESVDLYGNLLKNYLKIADKNCKNAAVNGDTSGELLEVIKKIPYDVKEADFIVITIGGNDLLELLWVAANTALNGEFEGLGDLIDVANDAEKMGRLSAELTVEKLNGVLEVYGENITKIIEFIRENNSDADVIFLAQYDPCSGLKDIDTITELANSMITSLNNTLKEKVELGGCVYLDTYTPFIDCADELTNILDGDIHPNVQGHRQLFNVIKEYFAGKSE